MLLPPSFEPEGKTLKDPELHPGLPALVPLIKPFQSGLPWLKPKASLLLSCN